MNFISKSDELKDITFMIIYQIYIIYISSSYHRYKRIYYLINEFKQHSLFMNSFISINKDYIHLLIVCIV